MPMPKTLSAENGAKALLIGEFSESIHIPNPDYCGCGQCDFCIERPDESETREIQVPVSWTTIKRIYQRIVQTYGIE